MNLKPYTYNTVAINDGTNYRAILSSNREVYKSAQAEWSERAWSDPKLAGKTFQATYIKLAITLVAGTSDALAKLFDKYDRTPRVLICKDADDSDRQWYVNCFATDVKRENKIIAVNLAVDEPTEWQTVTTNSDTWSITATGQTHAFNPVVIGNRPCKPIFAITPTAGRTTNTGYMYAKHVPIYSTSVNYAPDYPILLTQNGGAVVWNHWAEVDAGRSLASGNDIRVVVDGDEVDYWITGVNTTSCKIWINLSFEPGQTMTLGTAINDSDNITSIILQSTDANKTAMQALPAQGPVWDPNAPSMASVQLLIGSELFVSTNNNPNAYTFYGVTRAANNTAKEAHSVGDSIRWIQHDIKIVYGDLNAAAPTIDSTRRPIIDLTNSTNASWVYTEFASGDYKRTGGWQPSVDRSQGHTSLYYTGSHGAMASPATEMGCSIISYTYGRIYAAENAVIVWYFYHPFGVTSVTSDGAKHRGSTDWANNLHGLVKSNDGWITDTYVDGAEATPSSTAWEDWSHGPTALGATYNWLGFVLASTLPASASNQIDMEVHGLTLVLTGYPTVAMSARFDTYQLDAKITNNTTGESVRFYFPIMLNTVLTVDCSTLIAKYADGRVAGVGLNTIRHDWLNCGPGATTLLWTAPGTTGMTVGITWKDRNL